MTIMRPKYKKRSIKNDSEKALEKLQRNSLAGAADSKGVTVNPDGTATVDLSEDQETEQQEALEQEEAFSDNLVSKLRELDPERLAKVATIALDAVESDEMARKDWLKTIEFGLELTGTKVEEKNIPFEGACSAQHPLLMESAVKFQSKASNELLPASGPVKTQVLGDITVEKEAQANRVKAHMNYQILEEMTEFYTDSEKMLLYVPLVGSGFKKTYYDSHLERPVSEFIPADRFIVPNAASDLFRADRYTHILYKTANELEADFAAGLYEKPPEGVLTPQSPKLNIVQTKINKTIGIQVGLGDGDRVYTLYEQHTNLYIEGLDDEDDTRDPDKKFKLASPYIITVDAHSRQVIGIRRNWKAEDKKRKKKVLFTHFEFVPSFGFYGFGFLHLLGNLQLSLTSCLRSLIDSGQFANLQGGFKLKGVRIADDGSPINPGQFKDIETAVMDINKAIMTLPFKEPSQTLFQMLQFVDTKGQKFADSTEQVVADSTNYGPVGTTLALLDASTKFFSAIHKRLHASLKNELKIIAEINSETLPDDMEYNVTNQTMKISKADYGPTVAVIPVSDPNIPSNAHRMAKAQTMLQIAQTSPQLHDMREVLKHVYTNMDFVNVDKILPQPQQAQPQDPITDLQAAQAGTPIKAFPGQDHKAHIAIKQAFIQDPMSGQNPMMQKISTVVQANVQEHMMLQFVEQVQAQAQMDTQQQQQGGGTQNVAQGGMGVQQGAGGAPNPQVMLQAQAQAASGGFVRPGTKAGAAALSATPWTGDLADGRGHPRCAARNPARTFKRHH